MRAVASILALWVLAAAACATANDDVGAAKDAGGDSAKGGKGGTAAFGGAGGSGGTSSGGGGLGGSGGLGASGGSGGTGAGVGGDASVIDAGDAADVEAGTGFGECVTSQQIATQGGPFMIGFCTHPFAPFICGACLDEAVNPGDPVCSPNCICTTLPPLCTDGGVDAGDGGDASDAADVAVGDAAPVDASADGG